MSKTIPETIVLFPNDKHVMFEHRPAKTGERGWNITHPDVHYENTEYPFDEDTIARDLRKGDVVGWVGNDANTYGSTVSVWSPSGRK